MAIVYALRASTVTRVAQSLYSKQCCVPPRPSAACSPAVGGRAWGRRSYFSTENPKISPKEANVILRHNERMVEVGAALASPIPPGEDAPPPLLSISHVDSNQLAANDPIEDKMASAKCLHTPGFLFGVFDGHGGPECSQVVASRLLEYVAAALLPMHHLRAVLRRADRGEPIVLTQAYNDPPALVEALVPLYQASLARWCRTLARQEQTVGMGPALRGAFARLDRDLGEEAADCGALPEETQWALRRVALSGCVATVAHVDGQHLHVASCGDCGALLAQEDQEAWHATRLTRSHDYNNVKEVRRILSEHPPSEKNTVIRYERLLSTLMPYRAFGDFRFKWPRSQQHTVFGVPPNTDHISRVCLTPPYLTADPEVSYHRLQPQDRFLVLASDGLFDFLLPEDIVTQVGSYMRGRHTLTPVVLPSRPITVEEVHRLLQQRQLGVGSRPVDSNAATHVIRQCVGSTEAGLDHATLARSLTLPPEIRRSQRDDISLHVVFFDQDFLRFCPTEQEDSYTGSLPRS